MSYSSSESNGSPTIKRLRLDELPVAYQQNYASRDSFVYIDIPDESSAPSLPLAASPGKKALPRILPGPTLQGEPLLRSASAPAIPVLQPPPPAVARGIIPERECCDDCPGLTVEFCSCLIYAALIATFIYYCVIN